MIYSIFPLFADVTGIPVYIPAIFVVLSLGLLFPNVFNTKVFAWFSTYIFIIIVYICLGKTIHINGLDSSLSSWRRIIIEAAWILPSIFIMSVMTSIHNIKVYKIISWGSVISLLISFLYISPMLSISVNYLRDHMDGDLRPLGVPDYALMHAYALIVFPLCIYMKNNNGYRKLFYLFLIFIWGYVVSKTAVTTSLFLIIFSVLIIFIYNPRNDYMTMILLVMFFILAFILKYIGAYTIFIEFLMPYFEGTAVYSKMVDIHYSLEKGMIIGDTLTGRMNYHDMSREAFKANPLLGTSGVGGHSKILDVLGSMGLLVFIPYIMMLVSSLKTLQRQCTHKSTRKYLLLSFLLAGVFLYTKGIFSAPGYLFMFVIVPSLIIYFEAIKGRNVF